MVQKTPRGGIVYDADIFPAVTDDLFKVRSWKSAQAVRGPLRAAGRGTTLIVSDGEREFVWRRYLRGGLIGKLIKNKGYNEQMSIKLDNSEMASLRVISSRLIQ